MKKAWVILMSAVLSLSALACGGAGEAYDLSFQKIENSEDLILVFKGANNSFEVLDDTGYFAINQILVHADKNSIETLDKATTQFLLNRTKMFNRILTVYLGKELDSVVVLISKLNGETSNANEVTQSLFALNSELADNRVAANAKKRQLGSQSWSTALSFEELEIPSFGTAKGSSCNSKVGKVTLSNLNE